MRLSLRPVGEIDIPTNRLICCSLLRLLIAALTFFTAMPVHAQRNPASQTSPGGPSQGGPTNSPSSASLSGITYPATSWGLPIMAPMGKHIRTLCFDLVSITDSPVQPFILVPAGSTFGRNCSAVDDDHPLLFGDFLVVAVAIPDPANRGSLATTDTGGFNRLLALSINVTTQAASPINPAPLRPTVEPSSGSGAGAATGAAGGGAPPTLAMPNLFYLKWPYSLLANVVPTLNISAVYQPPLSSTSVQTITNPPNPPAGGAQNPPPPVAPPAAPAAPAPTQPFTQTVQTTTLSPQIPSNAQVVNLQNLTLSQVHALYYYNLSSGVVVTFKKNPTFYQVASTSSPTGFTTTSSAGDYLFNPVLLFTFYIPPMDAERRWRPHDLIPGLTWGLSLSSPSTSFFVGGSSEIRRNVQFVAGANIAKITSLAPVPQTTSTPITQQNFEVGPFVGLTVNIDFIKGLFGGGSSKSQ
jgi:hypothetical protein